MEKLPDLRQILAESPEILQDFRVWQALLEKWNERINLVSKVALMDFWGRHALDSWQLWPLAPKTARSFLDLGSGAGFPGIAVAIGCKHGAISTEQGNVTLVESAGKKASFLKTVIRELDLPAQVWADRAENLPAKPYDIITARAFAPLPRLFTYAQPFWGRGTQALLLKGENVKDELTKAGESWHFHVEVHKSQSDPGGAILQIRGLKAQ